VVAGWAGRATREVLGRSGKIDTMPQNFFGSMVRYAVIIFTLLATLQQFGVQTTSFLAVIGAAGLAIGLTLPRNRPDITRYAFERRRRCDAVDLPAVQESTMAVSLAQ